MGRRLKTTTRTASSIAFGILTLHIGHKARWRINIYTHIERERERERERKTKTERKKNRKRETER